MTILADCGSCLKENVTSVMRQEKFLALRESANADDVLSINAHPSNGFFVRDIGDNELAAIFERNKAAIEQMID